MLSLLLGKLHGQAERVAARHDCDLLHRLLRRLTIGRDGMTGLVEGGDPPVALKQHKAALLRSGNDLHNGLFHGLHRDNRQVLLRCGQCGLVEQVFQIGAGEAAGRLRDSF